MEPTSTTPAGVIRARSVFCVKNVKKPPFPAVNANRPVSVSMPMPYELLFVELEAAPSSNMRNTFDVPTFCEGTGTVRRTDGDAVPIPTLPPIG